MDNSEIINTERQETPEPSVVSVPPKSNKWVKIVLLGVFGVVVAGGLVYAVYWYGKNSNAKTQMSKLQLKTENLTPTEVPVVTPTPTSMPTPDPTADWKTYTNIKHGFTLKYPSILKLQEDPDIDYIELIDVDYPGDGAARFLVGILINKGKNIDEFESIYGLSDGEIIPKEIFSLGGVSALGGKLTKVTNRVINRNIAVDYVYTSVYASPKSGTLIQKNDQVIDISFNGTGDLGKFKSEYFDQILSTFKFLD